MSDGKHSSFHLHLIYSPHLFPHVWAGPCKELLVLGAVHMTEVREVKQHSNSLNTNGNLYLKKGKKNKTNPTAVPFIQMFFLVIRSHRTISEFDQFTHAGKQD